MTHRFKKPNHTDKNRKIKVRVGKGYDGHVVKGISKTAIFEKNDALPS